MAARTALLAAIFGTAAWVGLNELSTGTAMAMLGGIGAVYPVNRKIDLPLPHFEFFRVFPGHARLAPGLKLVLGPLLILLGLMWPGWVKLPLPAITWGAFLLGAWAVGWLESLKPLRHSQRLFEIIGAFLLILSGLYMLNAYFVVIPELAV